MHKEDTTDKDRNNDISHEEEEAHKNFLLFSFPYIFEESILKAKNDVERRELAEKFGNSPIIDFDSLKKLLGYIRYMEQEQKREEDSQVLLKYAKISMNTFLEEKTQKLKQGLSIQYLFNETVIASMGQALNEGFTEWINRKLTFENDPDYKYILEKEKGTYFFEVKFADKLVTLVGEKLLGRAYFNSIDDLNNLIETVDEKLGEGTFIRLIQLSDNGNWQEVFHLLKTNNK
jgi:hypothetical protein